MLIDEVVCFCDEHYTNLGGMCGQPDRKCTHPSGNCSHNCYNCLYHIHFPQRAPENSKTLYDCPKMLYHYVCQYSYLYTTELLCAFEFEWDFLRDYSYYHILSLGCGGCADLMAFDYLCYKKQIECGISYLGIDVNKLWKPIHDKIKGYCQEKNIRFNIGYYDVFECFKERRVEDTNIIILSYLISYLYNTDQITKIDSLINDILKKIIDKKKAGQHLLLVINDVNSNKRGRDHFSKFKKAISSSSLNILKSQYRYFDAGCLNNFQKVGQPYDVKSCAFEIPTEIKEKYHAQSSLNSTIQLILEVE